MKALVVAAVLLAARTASAHPCGHGFVLGKEGPFCPQKGSGYWVPMFHLDVGAIAREVVLPADSVSTSGLAPGIIDAPGVLLRFYSGFRGFHLGGELVVSWFDADTRVAPSDVLRAATQLDPAGRAVEVNFLGGYRDMVGPLLFGAEAAAGVRNMWRRNSGHEEYTGQGVVDVRVTAGVFLSPFVSLSALVGQSVLRRDEHSAMLMLGFSLFPWDGLR